MSTQIEGIAARCRSPFSARNRVRRLVWAFVWLSFFRLSPRFLHSWRRGLLRLFGANVSGSCHVYPKAKIWAPWNLTIGEVVGIADDANLYSQDKIILEDHVTISQEAYLCTGSHDYLRADFKLWTAPIIVKRNSWIAARAFIHPGVVIGENCVVAACAVVTRNVPARSVVGGNPAKLIKIIDENNTDRS